MDSDEARANRALTMFRIGFAASCGFILTSAGMQLATKGWMGVLLSAALLMAVVTMQAIVEMHHWKVTLQCRQYRAQGDAAAEMLKRLQAAHGIEVTVSTESEASNTKH